MATLTDIIYLIQKKSGNSTERVKQIIDEKYEEFSGMITKEAAAHLVAKDMGINIPKGATTKLQIKNLVSGMRGVTVVGRVFKISPINDFKKKNGEPGRVVNIFVSDGTGYTRVPLWNDQVEMVEDESIKVGDCIQIINGMTKENIYGDVEISIGRFGAIKKIEGEESIPDLESIQKSYFSERSGRSSIADLVPGKAEITGTIVQVFNGNFVFESDSGEKGLVISCVMDDTTGDIRAVFFRGLAEEISGLRAADLEGLEPESRLQLVRKKLLGKEVTVSGNVKKNSYFNSLEIIADSVKGLNPLEESKRIAEEIEAKIGA